MTYVLDTNTVIYFFKGAGRVARRLLATPPRQVAVPAVAVYELLVGVEKSPAPSRRREQLETFLRPVEVLPFDEQAATVAARIRSRLEAAGTPIGPYDILIAATAAARGATLVTHNTDEFKRIEDLSLEDWY